MSHVRNAPFPPKFQFPCPRVRPSVEEKGEVAAECSVEEEKEGVAAECSVEKKEEATNESNPRRRRGPPPTATS
ncbi:hypothetical protein PR002_g29419 [Phytophthora rubi]|uniref:Uncharacterized protein n=1 Tax=Phytophthora rubi TaxID=129364 RepID=A0A6A3H1V9_9STRA|nr:hypothetical protein PR002_g29419 [Phytophthora rubi]